jgi:exo-beta-1,3-glucanase (GH17 family)
MLNFINCGKCKVAFEYKKTLTIAKHWMHAIKPTSNVCFILEFFCQISIWKILFQLMQGFFMEGYIHNGVHKRNVLPQNHSQNIILNEHYTYKITYLVDFVFPLDIHKLPI